MIVARVPVVPALLDPRTNQPPMATGAAVVLRSSMNSSLPPFGPRTRNSEMTTSAAEAGVVTSRAAVTASRMIRDMPGTLRLARARFVTPA